MLTNYHSVAQETQSDITLFTSSPLADPDGMNKFGTTAMRSKCAEFV